jgi:hypothetical protein
MKAAAAGFAINTYSYILSGSAADTVARLADQGYGGVELMFSPVTSGRPNSMHPHFASCATSANKGCGWCPSTCRMSI